VAHWSQAEIFGESHGTRTATFRRDTAAFEVGNVGRLIWFFRRVLRIGRLGFGKIFESSSRSENHPDSLAEFTHEWCVVLFYGFDRIA
jgi:hypothetical protein